MSPDRVEDAPEQDYHPYRYFAECPDCGRECAQAQWERALFKAWVNATGPRTEEGKAASASNLDGHPTAEEARRTRFNALKHGLFARTATYFPARPGKYPHCDGCPYLETICVNQVACLKRTELFMKHHVAFELKEPEMLLELRSDTQAAVQALINDMILAIAQDGGPRIHEIQWYYDKDGGFHLAKWTDKDGETHQIHEIKAHPLLKPLIDYLSKNAMTLSDLGMTPKIQDEHEMIEGHLAGQNRGREELLEFEQRQTRALEDLRDMVERSQARTARDPVLIEHGEESSDG